MNVGGRPGMINNQTAEVEQSSREQSSFEEQNKNLAKNSASNNNLGSSTQKGNSQIDVQSAAKADSTDPTSEQSSNSKNLTTGTENIDKNTKNIDRDLKVPGENNSNFTDQREGNNNQNNQVLEEKLDRVIQLLSNIDNSTSSLNGMLNELSEEADGDPEGGFSSFLKKMTGD